MLLYISQAGIGRRVFINAVDINGKFKINAVSNDIMKAQTVDGSTLYDAVDLTFNPGNETSILKINNIDMIQSIHNAVPPNVYSKAGIDIGLFLKSYKINTDVTSDVDVVLYSLQAGIERRGWINVVDIKGKFKIHATSNDIFKIQKVNGSALYDDL